MRHAFDVMIVGAGPAGSTAAILLARAGWSVGLLEKQAFPRRKVCGECLAGSNLPLLDALGMGAQVAARAGPALRRVAILQGTESLEADLPPFGHGQHRWGRALDRESLDTMLIEQARAAGAAILQPCSVRSLSGSPGDFTCLVREGESSETVRLRAPVAIAAQGSWEPLPGAAAGARRTLRADNLLAFKANFSDAGLEEGLLPVISMPGGYGGMVIAGGHRLTLACCIRADRLAHLRQSSPGVAAGAVIEEMLKRECAGVRNALESARRIGPWLASGPLNPGIHFQRGDGIYRIGNAAGEAHPIIGEGISMAMQSAWILCRHLIGGGRPARSPDYIRLHRILQASYEADWRHIFIRRLRLAQAFAHAAMRPDLFRARLPLARHLAPLLTHAARLSGKVQPALDCASIAALASGSAIPRALGAGPQVGRFSSRHSA